MHLVTDVFHLQLLVASETDVYLDALLLDKAAVVNPKILPPPPEQHGLQPAFEFIRGNVENRWNITVNATSSPAVCQKQWRLCFYFFVHCLGLFCIN